MNVHILGYQPGKVGGGWSFADSLAKGLGDRLTSLEDSDVCLIPGSTMIERGDAAKAKELGKKLVLRVDNHLLPSRNRNTGMSKLKDFAGLADLVIYQSEWAKDYLSGFTGKDGFVILNGVDTELFGEGEHQDNAILYARSSRIAEKGWEMARYWFSRNFKDYNHLAIVGKFSGENIEYNFDFYNNEPFKFYSQVSRETLATLLQHYKYFMYSYFMDACSNTLIEALVSGCKIIDVYGMLNTGGAPEITKKYSLEGRDYFTLERMTKDYTKAMEQL